MKMYVGDKEQWQGTVDTLMAGDLPSGWEWVHSSVNTRVARHTGSQDLYFKQFYSRSIFEFVKSILRGSRCQRAIKQAEVLSRLGFETPEIICAGKSKAGEFMLTEAFAGVGLGDYLASFFRGASGERLRLKRKLLREVGEFVGKLHRGGLVHGDLRPNNILVTFVDGRFLFSLIDNERNKQYQKIPEKLIHKNLVQISMFKSIDLTMTDRLRLWHYWSAMYPRFVVGEEKYSGKESGRALMGQVLLRTQERLTGKGDQELMSNSLSLEYDPVNVDSHAYD